MIQSLCEYFVKPTETEGFLELIEYLKVYQREGLNQPFRQAGLALLSPPALCGFAIIPCDIRQMGQ